MSTSTFFNTIKDFPNYQISNCGIVRRIRADGSYRLLNPFWKDRHLAVHLTNEWGSQRLYVHRLVLVTYGPSQPDHLPFALHHDDDATNNHIDNLTWGDRKMNAQMAAKNGRLTPYSQRTFLNRDEAQQVRVRYNNGSSMIQIAKQFGCSRWTVSDIVNNRTAKFL
jgi:hypothetical protein